MRWAKKTEGIPVSLNISKFSKNSLNYFTYVKMDGYRIQNLNSKCPVSQMDATAMS